MKTKIQKLEAAVNNNRGNVKEALSEILKGRELIHTGKSGYSKGWAHKSTWTLGVSFALSDIGISHIYGNNAPRGGASGEFVEITDKTLLKQIAAKIEAAKIAKIEADRLSKIEHDKKVEAAREHIANLPDNATFEAKWNSLALKQESGLSWAAYRGQLKANFPEQWAILKAKFQAEQTIEK